MLGVTAAGLIFATVMNADCDRVFSDQAAALNQAIQAIPRSPVVLPPGVLDRAQLREALEALSDRGESILGFFRALNDGVSRSAQGNDVRELFLEYGVDQDLDFMPMNKLKQLESDGRRVDFVFDFDGAPSLEFVRPGGAQYVLVNGEEDTHVDAAKVRALDGDDHRFRVRERVRYDLGDAGIARVGDGDLQVRALGMWLDMQLRSSFQSTKLYADDDGRPILALGLDGKPLVQSGHYVLQRFSEWNTAHILRADRGSKGFAPIASRRLMP